MEEGTQRELNNLKFERKQLHKCLIQVNSEKDLLIEKIKRFKIKLFTVMNKSVAFDELNEEIMTEFDNYFKEELGER